MSKRIYTDEERKKKAREQSKAYYDSLTVEQRRAYSLRAQRNIRKKDPEKYRENNRKYVSNWMKNPVNRFTHHARTRLLRHLKKTKNKNYLMNKAVGKEIDHIIPLKVFSQFLFDLKKLDVMIDSSLKTACIDIVNHTLNIRYLEPNENVRGRYAPSDKIKNVAAKLEDRFPVLCDGLEDYITEWLKGVNND